jgi:hypothetical protein
MSELPNDLRISRTTRIRIPKSAKPPREAFAVCVKHDFDELIMPGKVYKIMIVNDRAGVVDEEGEAAVYPLDFFLELSLTKSAKNALAEVVG